ncbi:hypothetical protein E0Z10_g5942 [Xylaria hypoxylon]|uniref:Uncharacterized protein n=1 Tax=Xylaria hypoxylon TaxID=37992 RepID=A0A4Z0YUM2_9PEZI|nr:hypothetical protein E0Z10_g5942 [Xylaria hypoxylon]
MTKVILKYDGDDAASISQRSRPLILVPGSYRNPAENQTPSTSNPVPEVPGIIPASQHTSHDNLPIFQPINLGSITSRAVSQASSESTCLVTDSDATPNLNELGEGAVHGFDQEHTHRTGMPKRTANQSTSTRRCRVAYVEDADSEESTSRANSFTSLVAETGGFGDHHQHMTADPSFPESEVSQDREPSKSSSRVTSSPPSDDDHPPTSSDDWDCEISSEDDQSPLPPRSRLKHKKVFPRRTLRPRPTESPTPRNYRNPFSSNYSNYPQLLAQNAPSYGQPPLSYNYHGPQPGLNVPPYAPSAPGPSYESPVSPYTQYPGFNIPSGYPSYEQHLPSNPHYLTSNPNYFQQPPPPSTYNPEPPIESHPLDPMPRIINPNEHIPHTAPIIKTTSLYKPPVSFDPSGHDISFQIPLKSSSTIDTQVKGKSVIFDLKCNGAMSGHWGMDSSPLGRGGKSYLTRIRSLEHYADRSGQDRITIIRPHLNESNKPDGTRTLRWLHLQQNTLCLNDLRELIRNCRFLDDDLITVADRFLEIECAKFEKKYSSGSQQGYYIEPGTVLRCDVRYDQDPSRGAKSVFFCSVPYLQLGDHGEPGEFGEEGKIRTHPARTLMESLYDYDLLDDRDSRQAILQCFPPGQDSILYIPQIWYLLCGSDILISYSQLSLDEIRGDSIQTRNESERSLIAVVTDLDNHQFSVALKSTDSFFSAIGRIEALRSNAGGNTLHDYDLVLENDEYLIPKKWLDIVDCDPLPLLKITLKFRTKTEKKSLALTVRERRAQFAKKHTVDSSASDDDNPQLGHFQQAPATRTLNSRQANHPDAQELRASAKQSVYAYALTSYKGTMDDPEAVTKDQFMNDDATQHSGQFDESYTPTLVGSLESRQDNARRRMQDLESHGMVVNDILSVSNEPEVFSVSTKAPETDLRPVVWDYLVDKWDRESHLSDHHDDIEQKGVDEDDATPISDPSSSKIAKDETPEVVDDRVTSASLNSVRGSRVFETLPQRYDRERPMIPFLQWDNSKTSADYVGSDIIVRRVLDQVHDRLLRNSDHYKMYNRSRDSTLEILQNRESPLYTAIYGEQVDKILSFRSKIAAKRKDQLFQSSKDLIQKFIPINFDHDATKKIWGAVYTICQTLDGILKFDQEECGDFYLVQDYTGDDGLVHHLGLTLPENSMQGCAECSTKFRTVEDGIAHLNGAHFPTNSSTPPDSADENRKFWLRTPSQVQVEARINIFLMFLEDCTDAFKKLNKIANDLHFGSLKASDTEDVKGYPVFESLVRVFEHITIILTSSCDFMVRVEKAMRKGHPKVLDNNKLKSQLRRTLNQIVSSAQKDLEQAKVDIILASRTENRPGDATLASIGPEFIIAAISNGLFLRQLRETPDNSTSPKDDMDADSMETKHVNVGEVYKRYANKLQLQVNQRPQKRLLPDIYALEEELDILLRLNHWQQKFCHDFLRVLDPISYRITTKARISYFRTESHYLLKTIRRLEVRYNDLHSLQKRAEKLRDQLQQSIEIEEESHGKAIRVFTFVTLFFLPLSFVTSFFGMNTTDIRNTDYDQKLFWVTSLPTTALVIGVAYLYGYKWKSWQERSNRRRSIRSTKRETEHGTRVLRFPSLMGFFRGAVANHDLENGGVQRQGTDLSFMSTQPGKEKSRRRIRSWIAHRSNTK